jgi:tRNA G18 (ribose-2'-O)-methylase SpoU/glycosyltransferase involved in cell wall biosynthesis
MVNIHFLVTDFASHRTWIEGYQRYQNTAATCVTRTTATKDNDHSSASALQHDIRVTFVPGDRWKFRMMAASADLFEYVNMDDEILVVDAMLDATVLVALLKSSRPAHQCPRVFLYFHENQLTTPFTAQDRDFHKPQQTHWHYGMAHWRSLLVADGCIFNSQTHLDAFSEALPKCLKEQCPSDAKEWHLTKCQELLATNCAVLQYGLELDELIELTPYAVTEHRSLRNIWIDPDTHQRVAVILWNARMEDDKNPDAFLELLKEVVKSSRHFRLIILGSDPSKGQKWYAQFQEVFGDRILHMGWCQNRVEYARWLSQASIVVSTANHETFGISVVESVHCGALPLLPKRLSYPEIFDGIVEVENRYLYKKVTKDGLSKLINLMELVASDHVAQQEAQVALQQASARFRWKVMGPIYDQFFRNLSKGDSTVDAGHQIKTVAVSRITAGAKSRKIAEASTPRNPTLHSLQGRPVMISNADDSRIQLFRPKSLRDHKEYNQQWSDLRSKGMQPALHGGRRAMVRMLEAIGLGANIQPIAFLTTPELATNVLIPATQNIVRTNTNARPQIYTADKDLLSSIRGQKLNPGDAILAMVEFPRASSLDELLAHPPILILENVRNAENVGSILRTAFCLGIRSVVASCTAWAALKDSRAARCSMGTMYYQRYYQVTKYSSGSNRKGDGDAEALVDTIQTIRNGGIRVYGIEIGENAKPIAPHGSDLNWAALMGNEDLGLSKQVAAACDQVVFIPQATGDSMNVGHAAAIAMFELGREGPKFQHDGLAACT